MADKLLIDNRDSDDAYVPTDSEDEYSEEEKEILAKVRQGRRREKDTSKKEIMAFADSDDAEEDDDEEDDVGDLLADSDIEGADEDDADMPDSMDWGSKSRNYYNTDFVDPDYSTYNEQEEEMAKQEEEEAKMIQLRLAKEMKEEDFLLDEAIMNAVATDDEDDTNQEESQKIKADLSGLSTREQLRLFKKDSPEFEGLVNDFESYLNKIATLVAPVMEYVKKHKVPLIPALQFAENYQNIALTYCYNITFYLLLKAKCTEIKNHPITTRLYQLKKLLLELKDKYENIIEPQLEALLEYITDGDDFEVLEIKPANAVKSTKKKLSILNKYSEENEPTRKRPKLEEAAESNDEDEDKEVDEDEEKEEEVEDEEDERRGITYQIAKNKGLTPHRKKELRNPRVKHRSKFSKALIRRKGAVRTVRKETKRYGGEISGIKATVSKSIKFKS